LWLDSKSYQGKNLNNKEYDALKNKLASLSWEFPIEDAPAPGEGTEATCAASQLALTNGEEGVPEKVWDRLNGIVEKMVGVDKAAAKKFDQLENLGGGLSDAGRRLRNEMEDSLIALEDEKNLLVRLGRFKKGADRSCKFYFNGSYLISLQF